MHPLSPPLTIGGIVLKESAYLVILGVTSDSKMTFEKHLRSVSWAASQRLGILRKSWREFYDRSLLGRCFRGFVPPFWRTVLQCFVRLPIHTFKLLYRAVSGARFLTGGVLECDIAHRRTVGILCMLYKISCKPVRPLIGDLPRPHVPVLVTSGAMVAHRYAYESPSCRTSQYRRTFIRLWVSLWNDLANPVFDGVRLADLKSMTNVFLLA